MGKKQQLLLKERKAKSRQDEQKKAAERSLSQAKSRTTISLGDLFGNIGASDKGSPPQAPSPTPKQQKQVSKPRPGVPTVSKWSQNPDGSINGRISSSPNFNDGESITTSPVGQGAISNSVVITSSGSKYFLQEEEKQTGFFGFGGRREESSSPTPEPEANVSSPTGAKLRQEREQKRKVAEAEARRQVTEAARFDKEQKLKEAAKKQQLLLKERKAKSRQDEQKKAAERSLSQAKSRTTISLGDLFGN